MKLQFSPASSNDINQINDIIRLAKIHLNYDATFIEKYMQLFQITETDIEEKIFQLAYSNESLIGFYSFSFHLNGDLELELDKFFIHPNLIGKGIGRKLWQSCCDTAKSLGKNEFVIWSDLNTVSFYTKMGCEIIGVRQSPIRPDIYPPLLKYSLNGPGAPKLKDSD